MSGRINKPITKSGIIDGVDASFQSYCIVPFAATTLGTSINAIALTDQASSTILPKTSDFTVSDSDETISITKAGIYFYHLSCSIVDDSTSRENLINGYIANDAVPTTSSTQIFSTLFVNNGIGSADNYFTVCTSGVVTVSANDRIKLFGRGVAAAQDVSVSTTQNNSTFTLIKIN